MGNLVIDDTNSISRKTHANWKVAILKLQRKEPLIKRRPFSVFRIYTSAEASLGATQDVDKQDSYMEGRGYDYRLPV